MSKTSSFFLPSFLPAFLPSFLLVVCPFLLTVLFQSYGGKYVPSIAYKIYVENQNSANTFINLKGISVGDGAMHPAIQFVGFGDLLYYFGMADENQVAEINVYESKFSQAVADEDYGTLHLHNFPLLFHSFFFFFFPL
jgi:hypothetical protein